MRRQMIWLLFFCLAIEVLAGGMDNQSIITTGSLFEEMIDLVRLASYPEPAFRTVQFSSYDHRSRLPNGPDWFANADGFGGEPIPNFEAVLKPPDENGIGEYLVADVEGPGAIVRLWTAAISGSIRMYIDGSDTPVYDGNAADFFHRPYDAYPEIAQIHRERFNKTVYQRDASYAPIPFARHLRVEWTGNVKEIHFYQMQVRLYPKGTEMVSFSPTDIEKYSDLIDRVSLVLSDPNVHVKTHAMSSPKTFEADLAPFQKEEILFLETPGAVERFTLRLHAENLNDALRQTVLHIICDDHPWGQVQSPVGDFFGAAPGVNPYQSLPFTVRPDGTLICRFVMPFQKSYKVILENQGDQHTRIEGTALTMPFSWGHRTMYFRARWRADHNIIASNRDVQDLPFLLAWGKGVYVGSTSYVMNPNPIPTPWGNWWGEGDEKVFVDDDIRPSTFGTGSEDYYNYSWSSPDIFAFPYCGQPRNDGPGNRGFVTNFRWQILDPIPFESSIRFYMELFSHERTPGLSYARIGYHYAQPGITDDHQPIMPEDVRTLEMPKNWQPESRFGARHATFYAAEDVVRKKRDTHFEEGRLWSGDKLLVWTPRKKGEKKHFTIPVDTTGEKRLYITAALTPQSGKIAVKLDDRPLFLRNEDNSIDLYRPYRILLRNFSFTPLELKAGKHTLTLEYLGAHESIEKPEIGIDFIWVQRIRQ